jgi:N-methylhydantoinase A
MRYVGQGYEIDVDLERDAIRRSDRQAMSHAFEKTYERYFGRVEPDVQIEVVSWRAVVSGPRVDIDLARARPHSSALGAGVATARTWRDAWFEEGGGFVRTPVYDRYAFVAGTRIEGPALVEERESTVVVPPQASVRCDESLNLIIELH